MSSSLTSPSSGATTPLSISNKFMTFGFSLIFILAVQTSFASSSSAPLSTKTLHKKSTATKHLTDTDRESITSLLAQWKENNADKDTDQTASSSGISSSISSLYNDFKTIKGAGMEILQGIGPGALETFSATRSDDHNDGEYGYDHDDLQPEASHVSVTHAQPHGHGHSVLKPIVKEVDSYTFWDWLHSDGISTAVTLFFFGVLPIVLGLIPFIVIASNFWFIFHKIHGLYALFLGLGSHDDSHYGWSSSGWDSSGWPSSGWPSSLPSSGWGWGEYSLDH